MKTKEWFLKVFAWYPVKLPQNEQEFDQFYNAVLSVYGKEGSDEVRFSVAQMIQHLSPTTSRAPLSFFAKSIHKGMANTIAFEVMQAIKAKAKKEAEEKKAKEEAEKPSLEVVQ
jgi:uncharacterized protein (DUF2236 family)